MKRSRLNYVDLAKGLAMLLVMLGHCKYTPKSLEAWLYTFHMPLFFALSGYTLKINRYGSLREFASNRFRRLIIPYLWLSLSLAILMFVFRENFVLAPKHLKRIISIPIGWRLNGWYFTMWFMPTLFFAELLFYALFSKIQNTKRNLVLVMLGAFVLGVIASKKVKGFIWSLDLVPFALVFLILGYMLCPLVENNNGRRYYLPAAILLWAVNLVTGFWNYKSYSIVDLYYCKTGHPILFLIAACSGVLGTILVCKMIGKNKPIEYIGRNSLVNYAFQNSLVIPIVTNWVKYLGKYIPLFTRTWPALIAIMIGSCLILALMSEIIRKYFPFMIGMRKAK